MKPLLAGLCLLLVALDGMAAERWSFGPRIAVTAAPAAGVFPHVEGSGRRHIAVSGHSVAVAWEDNSLGEPQVFVAAKPLAADRFSAPLRVSGGSEAYEPAIASLGGDRYVLAWEQDGAVYARLFSAAGLSQPVGLGISPAGNATVATHDDRIFVAWRERPAAGWLLKVASLRAAGDGGLRVDSIVAVEPQGLETPILFPALVASAAGLCIAWEDRRAGHTRLLVSHSSDHGASFGAPQHLNEFFANRNQYDQGSGVTRVALASFARDEVLAAWMDKRRGGAGYGIYAALGADGGAAFGPNERVHGEQGDRQPHYNPATAGNAAGDFVVAWDDYRRGDSDIWLSDYTTDLEWSSDYAPAVASGAGEQSHPSIALDAEGRLHLLWLERSDLDAPGRLYYSLGSPRQTQ